MAGVLAMEAEDRPEWLPEGWIVGVRATRSGSNHTYYMSLESGRLFSSKAHVLNYLSNEKPILRATKSAPQYIENKKQFTQEESSPEWLPKGWILEIKARKSGSNAGQKYKCYFDPSTGTRCYSKPEVIQFLTKEAWCSTSAQESARQECTKEVKSKMTTVKKSGAKNELVQFQTPEGLPCGWIKEINFRKKETSFTPKKDLYYIDPEYGYVFRSFKDALRYVETGHVSERVKRDKRMIKDSWPLESESPHPASFKKQNVGDKVNRCLFLGQKASSDEVCVQMDVLLERPESIHASSKGEQDTKPDFSTPLEKIGKSRRGKVPRSSFKEPKLKERPDLEIVDKMSLDPSDRKNLCPVGENVEVGGNESSSTCEMKKLDPFYNAAPEEKLDVEGNNRTNEKSTENVTRHGSKSKAHKAISVPLRASKRLAGLEADFVDLKKPAPVYNAPSKEKLDVKGNSRISENSAEKVRRHGCKSKAHKTITVPLRASKRLAGSEAEFVGELPPSKRSAVKKNSIQLNATSDKEVEIIRQPDNKVEFNSKSEMEVDISGKTQKEDVSEKTGYDKTNDLQELPWDSWPDPCIEFAFKTLTNDIPLEIVDKMSLDPSDRVHLNPEGEHADALELNESTEMKQLDAFYNAPLMEKLDVKVNNSTNENSTENVRKHGSKSKTPKKISVPLRASKRLAGSAADFVGELTPSKRSAGLEKNSTKFSHLSVQLNVTSDKEVEIIQRPDNKVALDSKSNMEVDLSCKTEKGEVPEKATDDKANDLQEQPWNSWPDPCIEFAFKTLTSDIPFLSDTLSIEEYFQQQQVSFNGSCSNGSATLASSHRPDAKPEAPINGDLPNRSNLTTEKDPKLQSSGNAFNSAFGITNVYGNTWSQGK